MNLLSILLPLLFILILYVLLITVPMYRISLQHKKVRKAAEKLGIDVKEVKREVAFHYRGLSEIKKTNCIQYSIPKKRENVFNLKLLQRFHNPLKYSPYWEVISDEPINEDLESTINDFKEFFNEELGELEVDNNNVSIFWEEWGSEEVVENLFKHLKFFASYKL